MVLQIPEVCLKDSSGMVNCVFIQTWCMIPPTVPTPPPTPLAAVRHLLHTQYFSTAGIFPPQTTDEPLRLVPSWWKRTFDSQDHKNYVSFLLIHAMRGVGKSLCPPLVPLHCTLLYKWIRCLCLLDWTRCEKRRKKKKVIYITTERI